MALIPQRSEEEDTTDDCCLEPGYTSSIDARTRGAGELMLIRTLRRLMAPIFVPIFRPLVCQLVKIELAKHEVFISTKETSTSVVKKFKLQFRNKIKLPVYTGQPLSGENDRPIEIALVDALTHQIVTTGAESAAKLEILGFRVCDCDDEDEGSWSYAELQEKALSETRGRRILQGNACLQLKEGVGLVNKFWFTHNSEHTRNGLYRLAAVVADANLMNPVEVALTETFVMKDYRSTYHEKHACPALSDRVCHLQQISYNGVRHRRLKKEQVYTVKDLLELLYTDLKRLEDILKLKAGSKSWEEMVNNAQASNGMFLYLDPGNELKTGVVLDVKLQLKALIVDPRLYIAVNQLTAQQKVEAQDLAKFASEHFDLLRPFDHEAALEVYLQSSTSLLPVRITDGPPRSYLQVTKASHSLNNSNDKPFVTTQTERGKEKVLDDNEMIPSTNYFQEHTSFHSSNFGAAAESGTSSQAVESVLDTIFDINGPIMESLQLDSFLNEVCGILNESPSECQLGPAMVSLCNIARERWTRVSKLLRRNSVRERVGLSQGIQPLKKQRCC